MFEEYDRIINLACPICAKERTVTYQRYLSSPQLCKRCRVEMEECSVAFTDEYSKRQYEETNDAAFIGELD